MKWINKLERKFGRYAIRNLSMYIIAIYIAGYLLEFLNPNIVSFLYLEPARILRGEIWRLFSWVLVPPFGLSIFLVINLYFYYLVGTSLERLWGTFRYNLYIFSGIIFTVLGAFLLYGILNIAYPSIYVSQLSMGSAFSTYYICISIFLAFAATCPEERILLYLFIPIKMKWLGVFEGVLVVLSLVQSGWAGRIVILASLLNFVIFFFGTRNWYRYTPHEQKRKREFKKAVAPTRVTQEGSVRHKCAVCGRTEQDGDNLEFRYCSKCEGNYEYCQDHLFTHEHVKR